MTKKEILENNKIIAEFIGWKFEIHSETYRMGNSIMTELNFHKDWNLLIPVVSKCVIKDIKNTEYFSHVNIGIFHDDSELAFYGVSEFIKWYNQDE